MKVYRDRETGEAVAWCADPAVRSVIAGSAERLQCTTDMAADRFYSNNPAAARRGFSVDHPYDLTYRGMLQTEFAVLMAWHRAGGNA